MMKIPRLALDFIINHKKLIIYSILLVISTVVFTYVVLTNPDFIFRSRASFGQNEPIGYIDLINTNGEAMGWAGDMDVKNKSITIEFYFNQTRRGQPIGSVTTDRPRPDVNAAIGLEGNHGFYFKIPDQYKDGQDHYLYAFAVDPQHGGRKLLQPSGGFKFKLTKPESKAEGWLDVAEERADGTFVVKGWAKNPNFDKPLTIELNVDGVYFDSFIASTLRTDGNIGNHGFAFTHATLGNGKHNIRVYARDIDKNGNETGKKIELLGSGKDVTAYCAGLKGSAEEWCRNGSVAEYWNKRQKDTVYLFNKNIKVGINKSFGGTIMQLYDSTRLKNLIEEHGGSAIQLSIYGKDIKGEYTKFNACNSFASTPEERANAAGKDDGKIADKDKDAPWNPIQAIAGNCLWTGSGNNAQVTNKSDKSVTMTLYNPKNFSKKTGGFQGLTYTQKVTLEDTYIKVDYSIRFAGWPNGNKIVNTSWEQEVPAIFTAPGIMYHYYWGDTTKATTSDGVFQSSSHIGDPTFLLDSKDTEYRKIVKQVYTQIKPNAKERFWGVCDQESQNCVTVATFDNDIKGSKSQNLAQGPRPDGKTTDPYANKDSKGAYLTANSYWREMNRGFSRDITIYFFPYKWDKMIDGKTVQTRIRDLKP